MEYLKIDPRLDEHPDVIDAGFCGATVFHVVLRLCATFDRRGRLPGKFTAAHIARRLNIQPGETKLSPVEFVEFGISRCLSVGLLERDGKDLTVPGWEKFYKPTKSEAERSADYRERQKLRHENHGRHESHATPHTPPTNTTPQTPQTKKTEPPPENLEDKIRATYERVTGSRYLGHPKDYDAAKRLEKAPIPDILARFERALKSTERFPRVATLYELANNWDHFRPPTQTNAAGAIRKKPMRPIRPGETDEQYKAACDAHERELGTSHG